MITLIDTTLRDGEQSPGVAFSVEEKVEIAIALSAIGIKEIEAGTPIMGGDEAEALKAVIDLKLPGRIFAWNRVLERDIEASLSCGVNALYISCPVSDIQIEKKLKRTRNWVIERFSKLVPALKKNGCYVACGLEDASRADLSFVSEICGILQQLDADRIRICDTVGVLTPFKTLEFIKSLKQTIKIPLEIHTHNDFGLAAANTLAGINAGVQYASVTVNGMGERAGNAALAEVVMALEQLEGISTSINTTDLYKLSALVAKAAHRTVPLDKPLIGDLVFSHESGLHVDGILKDPVNYEPFSPGTVGGKRQILIGKHSGKKFLDSFYSN